MIKEKDVWETAREYGGVSVRYGQKDIYEIILPAHKQCCVCTGTLDELTRKTAKTISDRCYGVQTLEALHRVIGGL